MAFYTCPRQLNLPRSPDVPCFAMNATLPSIRPVDLLPWSSWRPNHRHSSNKSRVPPSPMHHQEYDARSSSSTVLPPIAQLDRTLTSQDDIYPSLPKIAPDAEFYDPPRPQPPITQRESPSTSHIQIPPQHLLPTSMDTSVPPPEATPNTSAAAASIIIDTLALAPAPQSYMVDWLDFTRTRSAHFIAEKTCEMICYLWFSIPLHASTETAATRESDEEPKSKPSVTSLQLVATQAFVSFMQKLLETTQVSQSVIVLSLHYIHRLKETNAYTPAQPGSEFRIAVTGLMMANKFLDDNTYTNKTWSEVSGISLDEINRMELEFLLGVDFNLYVDKTTYASWLNLLKGLVHAKERDARRLQRGNGIRLPSSTRKAMKSDRFWHSRQLHGAQPRIGNTSPSKATANASHGNDEPMHRQSALPVLNERSSAPRRYRARSTSPPRSFTSMPCTSRCGAFMHSVDGQNASKPSSDVQNGAYSHQCCQPVQSTTSPAMPMDYNYTSLPTHSSNMAVPESTASKRTAADAFASPPSSAFIPQQSALRKPPSLYGKLHALQIPEFSTSSSGTCSSVPSSVARHTSVSNPSPLEGLGGFENMNIDGDDRSRERPIREGVVSDRRQTKRRRADPPVSTVIPETLMAAYSADEAKNAALPKNLFFYTLASSPSMDQKDLQRSSDSSDSMDMNTELEPYLEPRIRKAKLRCQAAQPVRYGYHYADLNSFVTTRYAPLYSYHEPNGQPSTQSRQAYVTSTSPTHIEHPSHETSQPTAVPFPTRLSQTAVQSASESTPSYADVSAITHDGWARPSLDAQALEHQTQVLRQSPSVCVTGPGQGVEWFEGEREKAEQVIKYSDSPAIQTTSNVAPTVHSSSPYRHRYASTNPSPSQTGSGASSPYYQQQQEQNHRRQQIFQDVPSAPFANAGPPGVGMQFYATPEVERVHVHVPIPAAQQHMHAVYNPSSYPSSSGVSTAHAHSSTASSTTHVYSGGASVTSSSQPSVSSTYTYSGAHSTHNSPYHSAASRYYRYGDYGYPSQNPTSSEYGRY